MKHTKLTLTLIFLIGLGIVASNAQQDAVFAGGEARGSGGTMSFSKGQADFQFFSSEAGSMQFGLQQTFFFDDEEMPFVRELITKEASLLLVEIYTIQGNLVLSRGMPFEQRHTLSLAKRQP